MRRIGLPFSVSVALAFIGLVGGGFTDVSLERIPEQRGDYPVLEADFHAHTRFSDGLLSPIDVVIHARRRGLHALAITEHNQVLPGHIARAFSSWIDGPIILPGQEVTSDRFHIIAIGVDRYVHWDQPPSAVISEIHGQGGVAIAAHPVRSYWPVFNEVLAELDGSEVMHPLAFSDEAAEEGRRSPWVWSDLRDFYQQARSEGHSLAAIGSSDYHFFGPIGICRTLVFTEDVSAEGILDAIRQGRTVVFDLEGQPYGDSELIALLAEAPYDWQPIDYNYGSTTPLDRVTRTMAWFGLIGALTFRRRSLLVPDGADETA